MQNLKKKLVYLKSQVSQAISLLEQIIYAVSYQLLGRAPRLEHDMRPSADATLCKINLKF